MSSENLTFQQAMKTTVLLNNAWLAEEISEEVLADRVADLIKTKEGVRGFFVISLSSDSPLMDRLPEPLIFSLRSGGELVTDITVKNLAMSSAMVVEHKRNQNKNKELSSKRITSRCIELLKILEPTYVKKRIEDLLEGLNGKGEYYLFLQKWGYDLEQVKEIQKTINKIQYH